MSATVVVTTEINRCQPSAIQVDVSGLKEIDGVRIVTLITVIS